MLLCVSLNTPNAFPQGLSCSVCLEYISHGKPRGLLTHLYFVNCCLCHSSYSVFTEKVSLTMPRLPSGTSGVEQHRGQTQTDRQTDGYQHRPMGSLARPVNLSLAQLATLSFPSPPPPPSMPFQEKKKKGILVGNSHQLLSLLSTIILYLHTLFF